jgi:O-antigen biosynthesis protein
VIDYDAPFNFSAICNVGARSATGSLLLMLNNDVEIIHPDCAIITAGRGGRGSEVALPRRACPARWSLLGIGGVAGHAHKLAGEVESGYMSRPVVAQELSACTAACLLLRREVFDAVGGFNEQNLSVAFTISTSV